MAEPTGKINIPKIAGAKRPIVQDEMPTTKNVTEMMTIGKVKAGQAVIEVSETTEVTEDNVVLHKTSVSVAECAACGKLMKSDEEVGGACYQCRYLMCTECLKTHRCTVCGRLACPDHSVKDYTDDDWECDKCRA